MLNSTLLCNPSTQATPGLGLGLRSKHFNYILQHRPAVDWFEIISENFMDSGGRPRQVLRQLAEHYPIFMHGVSLSIGSSDPLNQRYLHQLKALIDEIQPQVVSDHLCWTGVLNINTHDLLPLPLNQVTFDHVASRVQQVQDLLQRPLLIENPSTYMSFVESTWSEPDFLSQLVAKTGCQLLLDVNNIYVSAFNNEFDPMEYLHALPHHAIRQMHLAGHQHCGTHIIDTHDREVVDDVWQLFHLAWQLTGGVDTCVEWDGDIPEFEVYHQEILKARDYMDSWQSSPPQTISASQTPAIATPLDVIPLELHRETMV